MSLRLEWIGFLLVALGLLRAVALVAHTPVIGYANQYDMHRTGACLGLFPAIEGGARYQASPAAPQARYVAEAPRPGCYWSTEVALAAAGMKVSQWVGQDPSRLSIRWIGMTKLALLALTALLFAWMLREAPAAAFLHGLVAFFILFDPVVTLWANTLYTEFAIVWSLYAAIGSLCLIALRVRGVLLAWLVLPVALAALAFSREQFALLPIAIAAVAIPWLWWQTRVGAVAALGVALVASIVSAGLVPRPDNIHRVNRTNVYLGALVPSSSDPLMALSKLKLPARCEVMVGASAYLQRGEKLEEACPEVFGLSSIAFVRFLDEPATLARTLGRALPATQHVIPPQLGLLEGRSGATIEALGFHGWSPGHWLLMATPIWVYALAWTAMMLLAPLALAAALAWARPARGHSCVSLLLAILLGGVAQHAYLTTVLGDGMSEAGRHYLTGHLATFAAILALAVALVEIAFHWLRSPRDHLMKIVAALAAGALIGLAFYYAWEWAKHQPLAFGVLDEPAGRRVPKAGFSLKGWALDPFGVENVTVHVGRKAHTPRPASQPQPDLRRFFPGYPDAAGGWFTLDVKAEDLAQAGGTEVPLRIVVKNRQGVATTVDGRRLEVVP